MGLKCGIVGLPNVGKSTLFNALTSAENAESANFPFCTIDPNVGVVTVPDPRMKELEKLVNPQKSIPTVIEFVDIAGLVKGASKGEGLGNQFLANIREVDAIIHVVRCFDDQNIVHVAGKVDPEEDKAVIDMELQLKDLESIDKKLQKTVKMAKTGNAEAKKTVAALERFKAHLESGENARSFDGTEDEWEEVKELLLLTAKPVIYLANVDEEGINEDNELVNKMRAIAENENAQLIKVCAAIEEQISGLEDEEEKEMFLGEYGLEESGLDRLIRASYDLLDLITYFTAGVKEVRAWTIRKGWKAPQAAGVIHTDFEKGFIRAEVIHFADYVEYKSELACKEAGKLSVEGKEYIVEDGDVMHFRFNV
ncbi:redox-regulated ATPase YchF [Flammeovirga sp. MY04]|uniref:redox-regulated ATPase YchF n=1 Tax=Flammeovirga sp. MY04 TaxID=1191459 RepID=UPI0008060D93|nr:redox-regulated ATPase YchF [Flammeovirga sp. MY04]ANQ48203.1 redox-regulated ATPase YchF [Flammeovirga sp. MY04]